MPRSSPSRSTLATAYHEAGHAVVSLHLGRGVVCVELTPGHGEHVGLCRNTSRRVPLDQMTGSPLRRTALLRFRPN